MRTALCLRTLAVALVPLWMASPGQAQKQPTDLEQVPRQAAGFVHIRAADLYHSEPFADLRGLLDKAGAEALKTFARKCPVEPSSIDRITFLCLTPRNLGEPFPMVDPEATSAIVIVRTTQPYDRLRVLESMGIREKLYRRSLYHFNEDLWSGLVLLDERTFLIGAEDSIVAYFDMMRANEANGPLQAALATAAAGKHHIVVGLNPAALGKTAPFVPPNLQALFMAHCGTATLQLGKEFRLEVKLDYAKADAAQEGEKAVRAALEMGRQGIGMGIAELEKQLNENPDKVDAAAVPANFALLLGLGYLREMDTLLAKAPIERDDTRVRLPLAYQRADMASLSVISLAAIQFLGTRAFTTFSTVGQAIGGNNENPYEKRLKALYQAMEKYHADKGSYPPPALYDAEGRPTLSWRVALLPYLGDDMKTLHSQFRLDESWDSLHNKRLIKKMPPLFQAINGYSYRGQWRTAELIFVGPGAAFDAKKGRKKAELRPDAVLLVHSDDREKGIYWSKPADLAYAADKPLPKLFDDSPFGGNSPVHVLLANGTFRSIDPNTPEKELRQLIEGKK